MIEIEKARIDCVELSQDGFYGKFVIEPLERGFGNTLGNALRRAHAFNVAAEDLCTAGNGLVTHEQTFAAQCIGDLCAFAAGRSA